MSQPRSLRLVEQAIALAVKNELVELDIPGVVRLVRRPPQPVKPALAEEDKPVKPKPKRVEDSEAFARWNRGEGIR